jgi:membrane fusion protein (multidrug efflux system)
MTTDQIEGKPAHARRGGLRLVLLLLIAGGLAVYGIWSRYNTVAILKKTAEDASIPRVQVVSPRPGPPQRKLTLPGTIDAWYEAPIYAQVSGYVAQWYKDYGAPVKMGDVLATIDTPGLDAQFRSFKAKLAVAEARYKLAQVTAKRWSALAGTQAVSQQEVDVKTADAAAQKAEVDAAQQDVVRYQALIAFKTLVAPFDGIVTARRTNVGDYVNAAGGDATLRGSATALFSVADIHMMRVFVSVPQDYDDLLKPGLTATLTLPGTPDKPIPAQFLTTANAVSPSTRTVVTELTVANSDHTLWPGTYVSVHFTFPGDPNIITVPEQALLFRAQGMQVALLDNQDRVHLQDVTLGANLDTEVQIVAGLKATDRVVGNPSLGLLEGQQVKVVQPVQGYQPGQAAKSAPSSQTHTPQDSGPQEAQTGRETAAGSAPRSPAAATPDDSQGGPRPGAETRQ